ncbi:hypothetical protein RIF29_08049 [Crotalaria pallida]|uniref:Uncharacterized protein n=1 Tax=Crotalaria pallida TaxID=3830 RepID=A0AAN9J603_CROPI
MRYLLWVAVLQILYSSLHNLTKNMLNPYALQNWVIVKDYLFLNMSLYGWPLPEVLYFSAFVDLYRASEE